MQDNYVAQWGNNESDKPLPGGRRRQAAGRIYAAAQGLPVRPLGFADPYAPGAGFATAGRSPTDPQAGWANLAHCYGSVGVGRDLSPDTGTGGELYAIIGHAPRQLDRNIAVVGRVIEGIEQLSSLPRGTEALGFYKATDARTCRSPASGWPARSRRSERPAFEYLDTASATFADYLRLRANRKDDFYIRPAGGVDLCNVQVPVRRTPEASAAQAAQAWACRGSCAG